MGILRASSVEEWQRQGSALYVPLSCKAVGDGFSATAEERRAGRLMALSRISTGPVNVRRSTALIAESDNNDVLFTIQLASSGRISQAGRDALLDPGDAVLYETNSPYEIDHRLPGQKLFIARIDRRLLGIPNRDISAVCGRRIGAGAPLLSVFRSYATALFQELPSMGAGAQSDMARLAADFLAAVLRPEAAQVAETGTAPLLDRLKEFIALNLSSPQLGVRLLAERHHVAERTVFLAFAAAGSTPTAHIRGARLRRALRLLDEGSPAGRTIASVALECGFPDASTFTRAFKREYGVTPTRWKSLDQDQPVTGGA